MPVSESEAGHKAVEFIVHWMVKIALFIWRGPEKKEEEKANERTKV